MNKKAIETMVKREADQVEVPDLKQQILARVPERKVIMREKKQKHTLFIRFSYLMSVFVIVLLVFIMVNNIGGNKPENSGDEPTSQEPTQPVGVTKVEKAYAKGASTLSGFIDEDVLNPLISTLSSKNHYEDITDEINKYFHSVSRLLKETQCELIVLTEGDYKYELHATSDVLGDLYETIIRYNEKTVEETKSETLVELVGVIIVGENEYEFFGSKETSKDECEITLVLKISDNNYITVSQEIEGNEFEYEHEFYNSKPSKNIKPYKTIEIEIEQEDKDGILDVSVEVFENGSEFELEFKYDKYGNNEQIDIHYSKDDDNEDFRVKQNETDHGKYSYHHKGQDGKEYDHVTDYNKHNSGKKHDEETFPSGNFETPTYNSYNNI